MEESLISRVISVAIIEDITDIRESLRDFLKARPEFLCEVAAGSVEEFLMEVDSALPPDIILLDIGLPGISGINGINLIKEKVNSAEIIMLTIYDDPDKIFQALCAGASGYLLKNTPLPKIVESIQLLYSGGAPISPQIAKKIVEHYNPKKEKDPQKLLTEKEKLIVNYLVDGLSYQTIATNLNNSIDTIRHHIKNIYHKLHVHSKAEVISKALKERFS